MTLRPNSSFFIMTCFHFLKEETLKAVSSTRINCYCKAFPRRQAQKAFTSKRFVRGLLKNKRVLSVICDDETKVCNNFVYWTQIPSEGRLYSYQAKETVCQGQVIKTA